MVELRWREDLIHFGGRSSLFEIKKVNKIIELDHLLVGYARCVFVIQKRLCLSAGTFHPV